MLKCVCGTCDNVFWAYPSHAKKGSGTYCSRKCYYESKQGCIPWNKGMKGQISSGSFKKGQHMSPETEFKKGHSGYIHKKQWKKGHVPWNQGLKLPKQSKENCHLWRGGITSKNIHIRNSSEYKQWRRDVFIRDEFTCQECGKKHVYIMAHHIKSFSKHPKLRLDVNNGQTLCDECHKETESYLNRKKVVHGKESKSSKSR